jgi:20S proteasome alpha/beta subunit
MTTIAYDGKSLASDSRSTMGSMIYEEDAQKIYPNVGPFAVLGIAGDFQAAMDVIDMIKDFSQIEHIRGISSEDIGNVSLIAMTHDGRLWSYAGDKSCELRTDRPFATGSGGEYALAAMDLGKTAEEAVLYASTRDIYTNNITQVAHIQMEEEPSEESSDQSTKETGE